MSKRFVSCFLFVFLFSATACFSQRAQQGGKPEDFWQFDPSQKAQEKSPLLAAAPPSVTHHQMTMNGQSLSYTATAETLPIRNATTEAVEGEMFYIYYSKDSVSDAAKRPLTFIFNGGPGSPAVWLHMLGFGPKRVDLHADGSAPAPPYTYKDNPNTLLDQSDLVFIDPIGTGYSRPTQPDEGAKFWGMENDVASFGEFVRLFLVRHERWASPKYVLGESYGTYRAAALSSYLVDRGIALNGVILISALLEDETRAGDDNYVNFMPTYALTAWYHKLLAPDLQKLSPAELAHQVEQFASGELLDALYQGTRLSPEQHEKVVNDLVRYSGLSRKVIEENNLRVPLPRFMTELMRDKGLIVGRLDGRVTAHATDRSAIQPPFDAADVDAANAVIPVFEEYIRKDLGYKTDRIYYTSGSGIGPWPGVRHGSAAMEDTFSRNPHMKLFVAMGYFDLATIYYGFQWSLSHLRISPEVRAHNITQGHYQSGHMIYTNQQSLDELRRDLRSWY